MIKFSTYSTISPTSNENVTPAFYIITREIAREYFRNIKKAFGDKDVSKDTTYGTGRLILTCKSSLALH
ncbi:MAG: hypothetical protein AAB788_02390 [Patescibacteria group bacterium]